MIESLQKILDRLCSPDLTIGESNQLRSRLFELLAAGDATRAGATGKPAEISPSLWHLALNRVTPLCNASL